MSTPAKVRTLDDAPDMRGIPWYRQVTRDQWRAFWAVFLGWVVDAFDFNIMTFILIDIQKSFTVDRALAGALGTVTLIMRLVGGAAAGTLADKYGRKLPLMLSIVWFSIFACLSGFSTSYAMLFAFRALFGIGMGGEWAAGMPLVLEHWPARLRGLASGLLLGGWYWGYLLSAAVFQFVYPLFSGRPDFAWRAMFWMAIIPALLTLWIRRGVPESPVWLDRQRRLREAARAGRISTEPTVSLVRIFQRDLIGTTLQCSVVIGAFMCSYYSINFWYPTFLREAGRPVLGYLVAFNVGAIIGTASWGRLSETRLGRRGAVTMAALLGVASIPLYLHAQTSAGLLVRRAADGQLRLRHLGHGAGVCQRTLPHLRPRRRSGLHLSRRRGDRAVMPVVLGTLQDRGVALTDAMTVAMVCSGLLAAGIIWLGPETRGRQFTAADAA